MPFEKRVAVQSEPMRNYSIRLEARFIERATNLAKKLNTDIADVMRQALEDQLFSADADQILRGKR